MNINYWGATGVVGRMGRIGRIGRIMRFMIGRHGKPARDPASFHSIVPMYYYLVTVLDL